jgi:phenylalanyl-tRNA synthetase beta chain
LTLPGDITIEKREIRGVPSEGMMCSIRELGLGEDHEGIILLPEDAEAGASAIPYLTCIELSVTPNRPDCLGWVGIAREIAAATNTAYQVPRVEFESESIDSIPITLESPSGCPRYLGRVIRGVKIGPSPKWLQDALKEVDLSPINNVVDVTNFVLMERGHPLHAFDLAKLAGPAIRVRNADPGETFVALNGNSYTLTSDHLAIADAERTVALAGTMGGANSEVSLETTDLLIECAYFSPSRIRRGSKSVGLSTDSSFRFERGVDPEGMEDAIDRCVGLILEVAGGQVTSDRIDARCDEHLPKPATILLRTERANTRIGVHIADSHQSDILRRLGCRVEEIEPGVLRVRVPGYRPDLVREIDLVEELARHFGYENIESAPPEMATEVGETLLSLRIEKSIRDFLMDRGWTETKSFSFISPGYAEKLRLADGNPLRHTVRILNAIGSETAQLRPTLVVSLLETLRRNVSRGEKSLRVFESGKVYLSDFEDLLRCEREAVGLAWLGTDSSHWSVRNREYDFFDAKGTVESLLKDIGVSGFLMERFSADYFHPGQCGRWMIGDLAIGVTGKIHPLVAREYDLPTEPVLVEIDIEAICSQLGPKRLEVDVPSPYPPIGRDLSLTVPVETSARELAWLIEESDTPFLEKVALFDRYVGKPLDDGEQSLGFHLSYRSAEKTLTEEEITPIHMNLLRELGAKLGASQRGLDLEKE